MIEPASIDELIAAIKARDAVLAVGSRTKARLSEVDGPALLSTQRLTGITQYEPSEFTFTALAGTSVREVTETLAEKGQYLPFDPCLSESGATLGGTVASGISGAGRFRYGGVRDFLIGIRFIDGTGRLLAGGGRVVKNAAGFDTPKFMVGSLGRLGVLAELTFKVFPKPESLLTLKIACDSHRRAIDRLIRLATGRWELDALDYRAAEKNLYARLGGPASANEELAQALANEIGNDANRLAETDAVRFWKDLGEMTWTPSDSTVAKIPLAPKAFLALQTRLENTDGCSLHLTAGGAFAWASIASADSLQIVSDALAELNLAGLVVKGAAEAIWIGQRPSRTIDAALKKVFDPQSRFPAL